MGTFETPEFLVAIGPLLTVIAALAGIWFAITAICVPGTGAPELGGVISLILASAGVLLLDVNFGAVLLLVVAIGFFLAQVYYRHLWVLSIIGFVLQTAASFFLFEPEARPSIWVLIALNLLTIAYYYLILRPGLHAQDYPESVGGTTLIGTKGVVVKTLEPAGTMRIYGEIWRARAETVIPSGAWVRVIGRNGLELLVVPGEPEPISDSVAVS